VIRIEAPHFTAGVVLRDGIVVRAAPIVSYMRGWSQARVRSYCERKGWEASRTCAADGPSVSPEQGENLRYEEMVELAWREQRRATQAEAEVERLRMELRATEKTVRRYAERIEALEHRIEALDV
jgi:hypothetical protein